MPKAAAERNGADTGVFVLATCSEVCGTGERSDRLTQVQRRLIGGFLEDRLGSRFLEFSTDGVPLLLASITLLAKRYRIWGGGDLTNKRGVI